MSEIDQVRFQFQGIGLLLENGSLAVPLYQRSYTWEKVHVSELLQDIISAIEAPENEYFIGTIVLIASKQDKKRSIVDGQQRLATISILLAVIRDYYESISDQERVRLINEMYLISKDFNTLEAEQKLILNTSDNEFFLNSIINKSNTSSTQSASNKRLLVAQETCKDFIANRMKSYASDKRSQKLNDLVLYIRSNLKVIWLTVPDEANAYTIFETLNDRGIELAISDLLKNYLFHQSGDRINEVIDKWSFIVGFLETSVGDRKGEKTIVTFLRHYWVSKYGLVRERYLFQKIKEKVTSKSTAVALVDDLKEHAIIYSALLNPDSDYWDSYVPGIRNIVRSLRLIRMEQSRPLLLAILKYFPKKEAEEGFKKIISWSVRLQVVGRLGGGPMEDVYAECARTVTSGSYKKAKDLFGTMKKIVPPDKEFQDAFSSFKLSKANLVRFYLSNIEDSIAPQGPIKKTTSNPDEANVEHILPKSPDSNWPNFTEEELTNYVNRLGNMTLLEAQGNATLGNAKFIDKKALYAESGFTITKQIAETYQLWGIAEIESRQLWLSQQAIQLWPYK